MSSYRSIPVGMELSGKFAVKRGGKFLAREAFVCSRHKRAQQDFNVRSRTTSFRRGEAFWELLSQLKIELGNHSYVATKSSLL